MRQIDLHAVADHARFGRFHAITLFWCALIIIFDGYDLAIAGIALPSIMKDMGVTPTSAGFMVSAALFGMMFGAIFLGTIADRIGRRWAIAVCIVLFSVFTAAAGFATDPLTFSVTRFLAGLGIGGVMPNVVAQMTEYSPRKVRSTLVTLMFSGYSVGGMLAALLGKGLLERYGWQSVFIAAGLPVLLVPAILRWLPESMPFLLRTGKLDAVREIVRKLSPGTALQPDDAFVLPEADRGNAAPLGKLFQDGRGFSTAMFWIAFFMCLFMVYALSSWLTKLMASAGYSLGSALTFVLVLNFGAMLGAIGGGWLADRFNIKYVLMVMYAPGGIASLLVMHLPIARRGKLKTLLPAYSVAFVPAAILLVALISTVEMIYAVQDEGSGGVATLFGMSVAPTTWMPWVVTAALWLVGAFGLRAATGKLRTAWDNALQEPQP